MQELLKHVETGGPFPQRISTVLRTSLWASLALVAAFALLDGEFSVRVATLVYLSATAVWLACSSVKIFAREVAF